MELLAVCATSFTASILIVLLSKRAGWLQGRRQDLDARQSSHVRPTPRIGGAGVFVALWIGAFFTPSGMAGPYVLFMLATVPLFLAGLLEDVGIGVSPRQRLLYSMLSSLLVIVIFGVWLPRIGIPFIDPLFSIWLFGVPLTLIATAGVANSINLIDGLNGLAALVGVAAAVAFGTIARQAGLESLEQISLIVAAAVFGFAMVNYPFGRIFLGDAGAYTVGLILAWLGIALVYAAPDVSPWAILLVMFWPVADTIYAMYRRLSRREDAMAADRLHLHQLVMRSLEVCLLGTNRRLAANSLSTLLLAPFVVSPVAMGVLFWNKPLVAFGLVICFAGLFVCTCIAMPALARKFRRRLGGNMIDNRPSGIPAE